VVSLKKPLFALLTLSLLLPEYPTFKLRLPSLSSSLPILTFLSSFPLSFTFPPNCRLTPNRNRLSPPSACLVPKP
jgi:hypothetical protein